MTRNPFTTPFTGEHLYAAGVAWRRLSINEQATWGDAARLHATHGERTTAQAEFMADYLNKTLQRLKREALK